MFSIFLLFAFFHFVCEIEDNDVGPRESPQSQISNFWNPCWRPYIILYILFSALVILCLRFSSAIDYFVIKLNL